MDKRTALRWKKRLEEARAAVLAEGPRKIEPNRSDAVTVGVPDEDAQALSEMNQTLASQWNRRQAETLGQIDRALRKLTESPDEFGLCEECEEEIPQKRLDFLPQAQLCTECQEKHDPRRGGTRRNLTDFR
jgi:DnaK suppressor protein